MPVRPARLRHLAWGCALLLAACSPGRPDPYGGLPGETVRTYVAALGTGDQTLPSGEYVDAYAVTVPAGAEALMASMASQEFGSHLVVRGPGGEQVQSDDASEGRADILVLDPAPGEWVVSATSARSGEVGGYSLVVGAGERAAMVTAEVRIVNHGHAQIFSVYASECSATAWGDNRLAAETIVPVNTSWTLSLAPGCWDLKVRFNGGQERVRRARPVPPGPSIWTVTAD